MEYRAKAIHAAWMSIENFIIFLFLKTEGTHIGAKPDAQALITHLCDYTMCVLKSLLSKFSFHQTLEKRQLYMVKYHKLCLEQKAY